MYSATLRATESLALYAELQPWPHLHHIVYSRHLFPVSSRFWGLARCGHHCFSDGRAARHSNTGSVPCRFCACGPHMAAFNLFFRTARQTLPHHRKLALNPELARGGRQCCQSCAPILAAIRGCGSPHSQQQSNASYSVNARAVPLPRCASAVDGDSATPVEKTNLCGRCRTLCHKTSPLPPQRNYLS